MWQMIGLGLGLSARCGKCGSVMRSHMLYHFAISVFLILLTILLLVWLGNALGVLGILLAFVIPVMVEICSIYWIPVSIVSEGYAEDECDLNGGRLD